MTTTITTTTVPCSYYLSAQAQSVPSGWRADGKSIPNADFLSSFGRSPECSVYADDFKAQSVESKSLWSLLAQARRNKQILSRESAQLKKALVTENEAVKSVFQFSKCESNIQSDPRSYVPPGVSIYHIGGLETDFYCCGPCTLSIREIRLLYFPPTSGCSEDLVNATSEKEKRARSVFDKASILITEGYTL